MRRLTVTLSALAFLWACAATAYLLLASTRTGIATPASLAAGGDEATRPPSLATADGVWMAGLLMGVTLMAGMPLGVGLAHPPGQRGTAWAGGLLLLGFGLVSGFSVRLLYLPSAFLLILAGAVAKADSAA
ncbi:MAG TPA: hypothetical protein VMM35_05780 [Longimicrobiales bacterium]|nr:hypothetical protein [Longimicrobiales bacterium]